MYLKPGEAWLAKSRQRHVQASKQPSLLQNQNESPSRTELLASLRCRTLQRDMLGYEVEGHRIPSATGWEHG
jgi:hypothetical protein